MKIHREFEQQPNEMAKKMELLDLHGDLLYEICSKLPLNALCVASRTCVQLQKSAALCFKNRFPHNRVTLEVYDLSEPDENDTIPECDREILPNEEYTKTFLGYIRNVTLFMLNSERDPKLAFEMLKSKCSENLQQLTLENVICETQSCGKIIKTQLTHLKSITFERCHIQNVYQAFLRHCLSLQQMSIIDKRLINNYVRGWSAHFYPNLKSFTYHSYNDNIHTLNEFLANNPQITNIASSSPKLLKLLIAQNWNLDLLHIEFDMYGNEFLMLADKIQTYCNQGHVKRLEISFPYGWHGGVLFPISSGYIERIERMIPAMDMLQGLYLGHIGPEIKNNFKMLLKKFKQLKVLQFYSGRISNRLLRIISRLPQLEELHLSTIFKKRTICGFKFHEVLQLFAIYSPNIKTISIRGNKSANLITENDIIYLHELRKKTPNSKTFTVYLDNGVIEASTFIVPENSCIQIKPLTQLPINLYKSCRSNS